MSIRLLFVSALALAAAPAAAQDSTTADRDGAVSARVTAGTLGIGPELGYRFSETLGVRAGASFFSISQDFDSDGVAYDGKVKLQSGGVMLDLYPFGGGFRISAGGRLNGNKARLVATPTEDVEIGDEIFTPGEIGTLTGRAKVKDFAPALSLGYGGTLRSGFVLGIEAGVLFQGKVRIQEFTSTGTLASDPDFRAELENERQELQDDVDDYKLYPILQLSVGYRF